MKSKCFLKTGLKFALINIVEKVEIYKLIDSLSGLQYVPVSQLTEKVILGITGFCRPSAALLKTSFSKVQINDKYVGDITHRSLLEEFMEKMTTINAGSAEFVIESPERHIIICVSIDYPNHYKGYIGLLVHPDNPLKHIIRQIVEIYAANMILALTSHSVLQKPQIGFQDLMARARNELSSLGVSGILATRTAGDNEVLWTGPEGSREIALKPEAFGFLESKFDPGDEASQEKLTSIIPDLGQAKVLARADFTLGKSGLICIFAGNFGNEDVVFSKFRSILADYDQPSGYDELVAAFKKLREDHKLIVKGERVAAILETAVAINHEINNPLTAVLGNAQLILINKDKLPADIVGKISIIEKSALRIRQVTQKLMTIVEPITTSYTKNLDMLDIDKSLSSEEQET